MPSAGFEPTIPAITQLQTYTSDCKTTRISSAPYIPYTFKMPFSLTCVLTYRCVVLYNTYTMYWQFHSVNMIYLQEYNTAKYIPCVFKTPFCLAWVSTDGCRTLYSTYPVYLRPKIKVEIHTKHVHFTVKQCLFLSIIKQGEYQRSRKLRSHQKCILTLAAIITISELRDTIRNSHSSWVEQCVEADWRKCFRAQGDSLGGLS